MNKIVAAVVALAGVCAVHVATAATVAAHAELQSSSPASGAMLAGPPDRVELVFSEVVGQPAALVVLGPGDREVAGGDLQVVDDTMTRSFDPESFEPGTYTVSYEVTSADGHPITGSLWFMVHAAGDGSDMASSDAIASPPSSGDPTDAEPLVVAALALALAAALAVVLLATRRILTGAAADA